MIASVTEFAERKREAAEELRLQARFQQAQMMYRVGGVPPRADGDEPRRIARAE